MSSSNCSSLSLLIAVIALPPPSPPHTLALAPLLPLPLLPPITTDPPPPPPPLPWPSAGATGMNRGGETDAGPEEVVEAEGETDRGLLHAFFVFNFVLLAGVEAGALGHALTFVFVFEVGLVFAPVALELIPAVAVLITPMPVPKPEPEPEPETAF
jgi:hypothetical protein